MCQGSGSQPVGRFPDGSPVGHRQRVAREVACMCLRVGHIFDLGGGGGDG